MASLTGIVRVVTSGTPLQLRAGVLNAAKSGKTHNVLPMPEDAMRGVHISTGTKALTK
jgi:hypothetical protein